MTDYTHGIPGLVLTGKFHSANGGLSTRFHAVTIVGPEVEGVPHLRPVRDDAPAVVIERRSRDYYALVPLADPPEGHTSYMASGAYVEQGGGSQYADAWKRIFGHGQPVPLHDYTETWVRYNAHVD